MHALRCAAPSRLRSIAARDSLRAVHAWEPAAEGGLQRAAAARQVGAGVAAVHLELQRLKAARHGRVAAARRRQRAGGGAA